MNPQSRDPKYIALLALVAGMILLIGNLIRPGRPATEALQSVPSQAERVRLQRLAQKGSLEDTIAYFAQIALDVSSHIVRVNPIGVSGVIWDGNGMIVTSGTGGRFPISATVEREGGAQTGADRVAAFPGGGMVAVRARSPEPFLPPRRVPVVLPYIGEWIVAVWRSEDLRHAFAPGLYVGMNATQCGERKVDEMLSNVPLTSAMNGGGMFDQEGRFLALIVECGGRYAAVSVESISTALADDASFEGRLLTRFGMRASPTTPEQKQYFGAEGGLLIHEVWQGYPADAAGLQPGDVIVALDGKPVRSVEEVHPLVMPLARETFELRALREGRTRSVTLPVHLPAVGVGLALPPQGFRIESVAPASAADEAGIHPGDRLLEIDGRPPRDAEQVRSVLEGGNGKPRFLVLERGAVRWGVLLRP